MVWRKEVDELKQRRYLSENGGVPERIERQHAQGKLSARERIATLADPGSFHELGGFAGGAVYDGDKLVAVTPPANILGWCTCNGRRVLVYGDDPTAGRPDIAGKKTAPPMGASLSGEALALHWRVPYIRLLDAAGASVRHYETTRRPEFVSFVQWIDAANRLFPVAPLVSVANGSAAGKPAIEALLCHFNVIVRGTGQVFPGGPPVVKAALGYEITKEDLGGADVIGVNGVIDNVAENEEEALQMVRRFLSYLPSNAYEMPPRGDTSDDVNRRDEELLSAVPREQSESYDPHMILNHVLDRDSVFEIGELSGTSTVTVMGRAGGYPVGVIIKNPASPTGGAMDVVAAEKLIRFLQLCDIFHLPIVCFVDEPGFMGFEVGTEAEKQGIARTAAGVVQAIRRTRMPWITFVVRKAHAVAASLNFRPAGMSRRFAWPSAVWGSPRPEDGAGPAHSPTAGGFRIEDVIDPRETRPILCDFIEEVQPILATQLGPSTGPSYRP